MKFVGLKIRDYNSFNVSQERFDLTAEYISDQPCEWNLGESHVIKLTKGELVKGIISGIKTFQTEQNYIRIDVDMDNCEFMKRPENKLFIFDKIQF